MAARPLARAPVRRLSVHAMLESHEAALRAGVPQIQVSWLADEALTLGASQREDVPSAQRARAAGIPLLRRGSGGTGVFFGEGDLAWAVILPRTDVLVGRRFGSAYAPLGAGVVEWLARSRVSARWRASAGSEPELCLLGARGEVLDSAGRVLGGAAQHVTSTTLLHEGIVLSRLRPERLAALFGLSHARLEAELVGLHELGLAREP
ncbi:MAG TPA: hypothetical protein VGU43_03355, partial [Thermoplasmata archaeon]|nr:hypothetical protein [Thermoplasmata archaeon]